MVVAAALGIGPAAPAYAQFGLLPYYVKSATAIDVQMATVQESEALDINNDGDIVGWAVNTAGVTRAFLYAYSFMWDIGPSDPNAPSIATGVNNFREVVGYYVPEGLGRPFYWHSSTGPVEMSHILFPGQGWDDQYIVTPNAINDGGRIVGRADGLYLPPYTSNPPFDGCHEYLSVIWNDRFAIPQRLFCNPGVWVNLGAMDVNNSGEVAGYSQDNGYLGYVWKDGDKIAVPPLAGGIDVIVEGINESGMVVGSDGGRHALFWNRVSKNSMDLGYLLGGNRAQAKEINDSNFIGGLSNTLPVEEGTGYWNRARAFIWHGDFGMFGLPVPPNFPATTNCVANTVNNRVAASGLVQLAGYCTKNGKKRAVRWDVIVARGYVVGPVGP